MVYTDQLGKIISLEKRPERIISIVPSQTELLYDLGLRAEIVGITKFCVHPQEWFRTKTRVGGTKKLNVGVIRSLKPDLIIGNKEENEQSQIEALMSEYPVWMSDVKTLADAKKMMIAVGTITDKYFEAVKLLNEIDKKFDRLTTVSKAKATVAYFIWNEPMMIAGVDTFVNEMLKKCGLMNIAADMKDRYPTVDAETIKMLTPNYLFLSSEPFPFKEKHLKDISTTIPFFKSGIGGRGDVLMVWFTAVESSGLLSKSLKVNLLIFAAIIRMKQAGKVFFFLFYYSLFTLHFLFAQKVGLVLSGGGARGLAEIGVIKALEENHIPIDFIAGTSSGAIVGSLYTQGLSPAQMDSIVRTDDFYNWATGTLDKDYIYYFRKKDDNASWITLKFSVDSVIQTTLPTNIVSSVPVDFALMENTAAVSAKARYNFDSLFVPFRCVAADIEDKRTKVFRNGDLGQAVRASAAYPFYFKPVVIDGKFLYDGGMYNNFPADIMLIDFKPDVIIGVNAAGSNLPTTEDNVVSQIRAMMTIPTNYSLIGDNGIMINVPTDKLGLFDFTHVEDDIEAGYKEAMSRMNEIKKNIKRRVDPKELQEKRNAFRSDLPKVVVDNVIMEGVTGRQSEYVWNVLKPRDEPITLSRLKSSYFQLAADENVRSIYPTLKYNDFTQMFDLHLRIKRENDLITQFGGDISSRPISEVFAGAQYNIWRRHSYSFYTNFYFGKLYTAGQFRVRMDVPSKFPYYLESDITLNEYNYFASSTAFFTDIKPSYIIKSDYNFGLNAGIPLGNKSKLVAGASYVHLQDHYYQTNNFLQADTADETLFDGGTAFLLFENSTLNRKMYANQGDFFSMKLRYTNGVEFTVPGSTSIIRTTTNNFRQWAEFKMVYDNYYKSRGRLRFGFYGEAVASNEPFFSNYTSTILTSPTFEPLNEMKTLYLTDFYAHQYLGAGSRNVLMIRNNLDFRLEAYVFQPYQELIKTPDLKTEYGQPFTRQFYIGSTGLVFHSPVGPASLFVNYYHGEKNPFSLLFHFGYLIFNKSAID